MNQLSLLSLSFVLTVNLHAKAATPDQVESRSGINVRIYNYAQIPDSTLAGSEREASRILRKAGIETTWLHCLKRLPEAHQLPGCQEPYGPADLVVRVLAQRGLARAGFRDSHLGFALPLQKGGVQACIFYPVVEDLASREEIKRDQILGHGLAHEIGHLLLSSNAHSPAGLMRAKWESKDLQLASRGELLFTREQARVMKEELSRRIMRDHQPDDSGIHRACPDFRGSFHGPSITLGSLKSV